MNDDIKTYELSDTLPDTPQELLEDTIAKVTGLLEKHFPDFLTFGNGTFTISHGSTQVMLIVRPFTNEDTCVECIATVVSGAVISPDLMKFLLRKNAELHFGAFGLLFDDTITFSHSITGSNIDANELITTLKSVEIIADFYDDIIVEMAGGMRPADFKGEME